MMISREQGVADVERAVRAQFPDRAEAILGVFEQPAAPSPEILACLEAAKAGAKFKLEVHGNYRGRRRHRGGMEEFTFDSRDVDPPRSNVPNVVAEANKVTFETTHSRGEMARR